MVTAVGPHPIFLVLLGLVGVGLVAAVVPYRRDPRRRRFVAVVIMAVAFSIVAAVCVTAAYDAYLFNNTYQFNYRLSLQGNGTYPESVIVPVPQDESLLAHLTRTSGTANWSLVDTPHGRGLFVRFSGDVVLETSVIVSPPLKSWSSGEPTMTAASNCTMGTGNCTGFPRLWLFYSGIAGVYVSFSNAWYNILAYPSTGWGSYEIRYTLP